MFWFWTIIAILTVSNIFYVVLTMICRTTCKSNSYQSIFQDHPDNPKSYSKYHKSKQQTKKELEHRTCNYFLSTNYQLFENNRVTLSYRPNSCLFLVRRVFTPITLFLVNWKRKYWVVHWFTSHGVIGSITLLIHYLPFKWQSFLALTNRLITKAYENCSAQLKSLKCS